MISREELQAASVGANVDERTVAEAFAWWHDQGVDPVALRECAIGYADAVVDGLTEDAYDLNEGIGAAFMCGFELAWRLSQFVEHPAPVETT